MRTLLTTILVLGVMLTGSQSQAADPTYLFVTGQKQGVIKGSAPVPAHADGIEVLSCSHDIVSPRDAASGLPTGKRMHKPFVLDVVLDKASPDLYNALVTNENLSDAKIKFYTKNATGVEVLAYTVELTNATIASISFRMPESNSTTAPTKQPYLEVSLTYQKIVWTWAEGAVTSTDNWTTP